MNANLKKLLLSPIVDNNPIALQILGINDDRRNIRNGILKLIYFVNS